MADDATPNDAPDAVAPEDIAPEDEVADGDAPDDAETDAEAESAEPDGDAVFTTPRLEAIRAPISASSPAGDDMKYDDDFQALKAEVDRLGAATGEVDFGAIVGLATTILSERSKDLTAASYLVLGLTRTDGFAGIAEGVAAVRAVAEGFWEDAFPPLRRMRGRQAALQFVAERTSAWIKDEDRRAEPEDRPALETAQAELAALQTFVTEAMGDDAPALGGLGREIREALRRLPEPVVDEPEPEPEPEPDAAASDDTADAADDAQASAPAAAPAAPAKPAAAPAAASVTDLSQVRDALLGIANVIAESDPLHAVAFTLRRAALWGELAQAPPPGVFPPPPQMRRDAFDTMLAAGNYAVFVEQAESYLAQHPFRYWLDLQRLLATALKALGAPARPAIIAVESATAALVKRLPALPTLAFNDDTPFADALTVSWLGSLSGDADAGPADDDDATGLAIAHAREQADEGDVPGAVGALMAGAGATRDRFERSVAAAELCLAAGRPDIALGFLDGVAQTIDMHGLDVWDPDSAARAYRLIHLCAQATDDYGRSEDAFQRLITLDPGHAIRSTHAP